MELQGKKVLVFGSGKSGIGASDLLAKVGAFPVIYDGNAETDKDAVVHKTSFLMSSQNPCSHFTLFFSFCLLLFFIQ